MKVLLTGASGFIGSNLVEKLEIYGIPFLGISGRKNEQINSKHIIKCNLVVKNELLAKLKTFKPEVLIHLAYEKKKSNYPIPNKVSPSLLDFSVVNAALEYGRLNKFIYMGSCEEYGRQVKPFNEQMKELPISLYGKEKLATTNFLRKLYKEKELNYTVIRPSVVYGPNAPKDMFISSIINSFLNNEQLKLSPGEQFRDFIFIEDVVSAIVTCINNEVSSGKVINIASGKSHQLKVIAELIANYFDHSGVKAIFNFGGIPYRDDEIFDYFVETSLAKSLLDWQVKYSLERGISITCDFYKNEHLK